MRLGLFMMPLHPPTRDYHEMLEEDLEAVLEADRLGFDDVWIGEHFSSMTEPITSPLIFLAKAIPLTERVRLCTGVLNLPQQHPAVVAGFAAMFDHLAEGRFVMGIGPGGLPSTSSCSISMTPWRGKMTLESIDIILKIWTGEPPYRIEGEFWQIRQDEWYWPELGLGSCPSLTSSRIPDRGRWDESLSVLRQGKARRGWMAISANFIPAASVATWQGSARAAQEAASRRMASAGTSRARCWSPRPMPRLRLTWHDPRARSATTFTTSAR